jgi:hypothetical protein
MWSAASAAPAMAAADEFHDVCCAILLAGQMSATLPERVVLMKEDSAKVAHVDVRVALSKSLPQSSDEGMHANLLHWCPTAAPIIHKHKLVLRMCWPAFGSPHGRPCLRSVVLIVSAVLSHFLHFQHLKTLWFLNRRCAPVQHRRLPQRQGHPRRPAPRSRISRR